MIIGLTGRISAGKGVVVEYFEERGFLHLTFSDAIIDEMKVRGILIERARIQDTGNELRNKYGAGIWAKRLLEKMLDKKGYIVDGIRNPGEIYELRKRRDFYLISIDAPQKQRFERLIKRAKPSDPKIWEDFLVIDKRDFAEDDPNGQQVGKCMEMADYNLMNDSSVEGFKKKIEEIYGDILLK